MYLNHCRQKIQVMTSGYLRRGFVSSTKIMLRDELALAVQYFWLPAETNASFTGKQNIRTGRFDFCSVCLNTLIWQMLSMGPWYGCYGQKSLWMKFLCLGDRVPSPKAGNRRDSCNDSYFSERSSCAGLFTCGGYQTMGSDIFAE